MKKIIRKIVGPFYSALFSIPEIVSAPSYYPEKKRKCWLRRYGELVYTRFVHGLTDHYYNAYGKDCKGFEDSGYVQEYDFWRKIIPLNWQGQTNYAVILRDKYLFDVFMRAHGVKVADTVGWVNHGHFYMMDGTEVSAARFLELMALQDGVLFVKAATSCCARGVMKVVADAGGLCVSGSRERLNSEWFKNEKYIVQRAVQNCDEISAIQPNSVNTLRIVTLWNQRQGHAELLSNGGLRVGGGGAVDNWAQGGLFVGIDDEGRLQKYGFYKPGKHESCKSDRQPQTGFVFGGFQIPYYHEAIESVLKAHSFLPEVVSIGWDVALTPDGPVIIEGNDDWEITLMQMVAGGLKMHFNDLFALHSAKEAM